MGAALSATQMSAVRVTSGQPRKTWPILSEEIRMPPMPFNNQQSHHEITRVRYDLSAAGAYRNLHI